MTSATELKDLGNKALAAKDFDKAIEFYTKGIDLEPKNHILYSNRSAAFASVRDFDSAIKDALKIIELQPTWAKGYSRLGAAYEFVHKYDQAIEAYTSGIEVDPENQQLKQSLESAKKSMKEYAAQNNPPFTHGLEQFGDEDFVRRYLQHMSNPGSVPYDPKFDELTKFMDKKFKDSGDMTEGPPDSNKPKKTSEEDQANVEKEAGNNAYKSKNFTKALEHYRTAQKLCPNDITYINNIAAVYLEMGDYGACIEECESAIEIGRSNCADYKLIARSLARIGTAYMKKGDKEQALVYYKKSLTEFRDPALVKKVRVIEAEIKEMKEKEYIDPELADKERELGNQAISVGDFPGAIKHYTEAARRNPSDYRIYSNRAMAFQKLMQYNLAQKDSELCISLKPDFVKGYLRKANALLAMKDYFQAQSTFEKALSIENNCTEAINGINACREKKSHMTPEQTRELAGKDPEIQEILKDPSMRIVLDQMQSDPAATAKIMSNPVYSSKIMKLIEAGFIQMK